MRFLSAGQPRSQLSMRGHLHIVTLVHSTAFSVGSGARDPVIGAIDGTGDELELDLVDAQIAQVVNQIAPWVGQPGNAGDERHDTADLEIALSTLQLPSSKPTMI